MITDDQAREIALFFLLSLLDQKIALQAAHKAIAQVKTLSSDDGSQVGAPSKSEVVRILKRGFDAHRKILPRNQQTEISPDVIAFPFGTDLQTWEKFHRASSDQEITAVVLIKVLKFSEQQVAEGFQISVGTAKYRLSKGMRQLGQVIPKLDSSRGRET